MIKEIRCPYCQLYNNTITNHSLEFIHTADAFTMECNKCGKLFLVEVKNDKYKSSILPCRHGKPHLFKWIDEYHKQCDYCKQIISIVKT